VEAVLDPRGAGFVFNIGRRSANSADVDDLTRVLRSAELNETDAPEKLLERLYAELRQLAAAKMGRENGVHTLQPTALVHEAWLRLGGDDQPAWRDRGHFFGAAAEAMRRILIERARKRQAVRHGAGQERLNLDDVDVAGGPGNETQLLMVDDALARLEIVDARIAQLVKLRYFTGLTLEECGQALDVSEITARRWWAFAKSWLYREIQR
jgi:RNA polymerase sigma factor (TIGR02999 family)